MPESIHAEFLSTRRSASPKCLVDPAPEGDELRAILTIASRTPDHGRVVPWRFVVLTGRGLAELGDAVGAAFWSDHPQSEDHVVAAARQRFDAAPLIVCVVCAARPEHPNNPKIPEFEQVLTVGAVCMNLLHACRAHGYGAVWLTGWAAEHPMVRAHLEIEGHERVAGFVHIGTETDPRDDRERPDVGAITTVRG
jgi:nitroreductase